MAQQVATKVARTYWERALAVHPSLVAPSPELNLTVATLRSVGLSESRASCCVSIVENSGAIKAQIAAGHSWEDALHGIKGIGPWTVAVFRIMVLRDADVLPTGDVGLIRAIKNLYGASAQAEEVAERWSPYRSVACWYLWGSLGNEQLG